MNDALAVFHFLRPWWLLLLPLSLYLYWHLQSRRQGAADWRKVCDPQLLAWLTRKDKGGISSRWPMRLLLLAWLLGILAVSGPTWERLENEGMIKQWPRVLVLDLSAAMLATDLAPNRLQQARFKLADILDRTGDEQVALVTFSGDAFIAAPLTADANTIKELLRALHPGIMPVGGQRADIALATAADLIRQAGMNRGEILLLTDAVDGRTIDQAAALRRQGLLVSVLGVGTPQGAPIPLEDRFLKDQSGQIVLPKLNEGSLRELAAAGGGRYARMSADERDIGRLLLDHDLQAQFMRGQGQQTLERWRERGPWLVLALLPLAALAFRRGWLLAVSIVLLPMPRAEAGLWDDLWQRSDQQAVRALQQGRTKTAAELAREPMLAGEAHYRSGQYEEALESFQQANSAGAHYNRGNTLAQLGRLDEALKAYDEALSLDPENEDAAHNKALVEQMRQQQQQQSGEGGDAEQDQQSGDQQQNQNQEQQGQQGQQDSADQQQQDQGQDSSQSDSAESEEQQQSQSDSQRGEQNDDNDQSRQSSANQEETDEEPAADQEQAAAEQQQAEQEQPAQEQEAQAGKEGDEQSAQALQAEPMSQEEREQQQAMEQWLRRIPDDPGGLLRRKFQREYQRHQGRDRAGQPSSKDENGRR